MPRRASLSFSESGLERRRRSLYDVRFGESDTGSTVTRVMRDGKWEQEIARSTPVFKRNDHPFEGLQDLGQTEQVRLVLHSMPDVEVKPPSCCRPLYENYAARCSKPDPKFANRWGCLGATERDDVAA